MFVGISRLKRVLHRIVCSSSGKSFLWSKVKPCDRVMLSYIETKLPTMRKLLFLVLTIFIGCFAQAQDKQTVQEPVPLKIDTISMPIIHNTKTTALQFKALPITGIFIMKHSRVKRALNFKVKETNPTLA